MNEFDAILEKHLQRYPALEIQDLVKLIYQQEFGGGHMIADPQRSLQRLHQELEQIRTEEADHDYTATPPIIRRSVSKPSATALFGCI